MQQPARGERGRDGEQEVHPEAPPPAEVLGQQTAHDQADRRPADSDGREDAERLGPLVGVDERRRQQREGSRREQRPEQSLEGARPDEHLEVLGESAERARPGEAGQADDEDALATEQVADPPAQQEQAAERKRVRGDDPLALVVAEGERLLGRRQGDVDDRRVEHDHQLSHRDHEEDQPASCV